MADGTERVERVKKLVNDLDTGALIELAVVVIGVIAGIWVARRVLVFVAGLVPSRLRIYVLSAVPVLRLLLLLAGITLIIPLIFNVTFGNFVFVAGGLSVAVGFALKDLASNVIAGIVVLFERPYRAGDWVRIGDDYGEVVYVGMRAVQLLTPDDDKITVPHDRIWQDNIASSNDGENTLMCVVPFFVAGTHDGKKVRSLLTDVALTSAYLAYHRPVIVIVEQEPWGTRYRLKAYPFNMRDQFLFKSDLTVRGRDALAEDGIRLLAVPALPETGSAPA